MGPESKSSLLRQVSDDQVPIREVKLARTKSDRKKKSDKKDTKDKK